MLTRSKIFDIFILERYPEVIQMNNKNKTSGEKRYLCNGEYLTRKELEERISKPLSDGHEHAVDNFLKEHYKNAKRETEKT